MIIQPGRPFWSAVWAFGSSMLGLVTMDRVDTTPINIEATFLGALIVSSFVFLVVYAKEKITEAKGRDSDHRALD